MTAAQSSDSASMRALDLWLVRHAESVGNVDRTEADTPLSEVGFEQARALGAAFAGPSFDQVWTSPLTRAVQTAQIALPGTAATVDVRLAEFVPPTPTRVVDPRSMSAQAIHDLLMTPSSVGESGLQFKARVAGWVAGLPATGSILVVSHFAVIREIIGSYLGFREAPQAISHTGIFRLSVRERAEKTRTWNETRHLGTTGVENEEGA